MGTADTPAEPMRGLILPPDTLYMILPINRPPMVENMKAITPSTTIIRVWRDRNRAATVVAPTLMPKNRVTMFIRAFWAVSLSRSVTPVSLSRLPNMRQPISGAVEGMSRMTKVDTAMGKTIFSTLDTFRACSIFTFRSFSVVRARIRGFWIMGISAI